MFLLGIMIMIVSTVVSPPSGQNTGLIGAQASASHVPQVQAQSAAAAQVQAPLQALAP